MAPSKKSILAIFVQKTGRTTTRAGAVPDLTVAELAKRQGYWVDRTNHFKGW